MSRPPHSAAGSAKRLLIELTIPLARMDEGAAVRGRTPGPKRIGWPALRDSLVMIRPRSLPVVKVLRLLARLSDSNSAMI